MPNREPVKIATAGFIGWMHFLSPEQQQISM